jgi:hypothetical protein
MADNFQKKEVESLQKADSLGFFIVQPQQRDDQ